MPVPLQIALGVVIAALVALILFRRRPARRPAAPPAPPAPEVIERLRSLLAANKKIHAIKELREHTGMGLRDAKEYVERLTPGEPLPPSEPPDELSSAGLAEANRLIAAGKYIQAVKAIRDDTGWPLQRAKDTMDRLRRSGPR